MKKLRIGIIGVGKIAESAHLPSLLKSETAELVLLIDSSAERVTQFKETYGLDTPHCSSLDEMPDTIDAVIVCTPNHTHKDICITCLDRGVHVLVEKPLTNTVEDAVGIERKAKETGCVVMAGYCTRYWKSVQYVKSLLDRQMLGAVKKFVFQYGAAGGWAPYSNYILSRQQAGGGAFVINGSHYLDRMLWYFGVPERHVFYDDEMGGLEANALAEFHYQGEGSSFKGIIRVSKTVSLDAGCYIECEKGTIIHNDWKSPTVSLKLNDAVMGETLAVQAPGLDFAEREDMYLMQLDEFVRRIVNQSDDGIASLEDAVNNVRIAAALYENKQPMECHWYK